MSIPICDSKVIVLVDTDSANADGCYMVDNHPSNSHYIGTNHMDVYASHNQRISFIPMNMDGQYTYMTPKILNWSNSGAWGYCHLPQKYTTDEGLDVWVAEIGGRRGQTYPVRALCCVGDTGETFFLNFSITVA